jgi:hypothetical protein
VIGDAHPDCLVGRGAFPPIEMPAPATAFDYRGLIVPAWLMGIAERDAADPAASLFEQAVARDFIANAHPLRPLPID